MHAGTEQAGAGQSHLAAIQARIAAAAARAGRSPADITLIAVSKVQPAHRIEAVLADGQRVFGENYVQEAAGRWPAYREIYPDLEIHLIGALQSNKALDAVKLFDVIQTLDRPKLAAALARAFERLGLTRPLYVEVNTGGEAQKAGIRPEELDPFIAHCRRDLGLPIEGLMAIPPSDDDVAPHTALLGRLAARNGLGRLSIGMSADFETAIRFGATHVRIGSALFGERQPRKAEA
ncbi:hypothetical protein SAMN07250955_11423 [Arboricoccus pini]|uniref:Pyridoxal phosphate homeostasis protein n=1 Tax=Arboricoccus pini TaxID=1963835 RepID=A0A212RTM2_9PROT|nr:YggS family pyridoxal phosphate-dependent enzyme [Arboricoccus pini]SNB75853.1 hypothetical protein SAMN07250955_11423 [Arboricoccus pini]